MNCSVDSVHLRYNNKQSYVNKIHNANTYVRKSESVLGDTVYTFLPNLHEIVSAAWIYKEQAYLSKKQFELINRYLDQAGTGLEDIDLIQLDIYFGSLRDE